MNQEMSRDTENVHRCFCVGMFVTESEHVYDDSKTNFKKP